ncbi:MAG: GGDEF domain-containing protein [Candidatus Shapirobacteria bacterium]
MSEKRGLNPMAMQKIAESFNNSEPDNSSGFKVIKAANKIYQKLQEGEEAQKNSYIDSLTGLYNRRYLDDYAKNFDISRNKKRVGIGFFDVNNLKAINTISDKLGDEVIIKTAKCIKKSVREEDKVIRKGGDEDVVIFENFEDFNILIKSISERMDKNMINEGISVAYGFVEYDSNKDESFLDTVERGNGLMKQKKLEQKSQQNFPSQVSTSE